MNEKRGFPRFFLGGALGMLGALFFDPQQGKRRRKELIELNDLVAKTRKVQGVRDVESLLHLPGTPAPMHQ